MFAKLLLTLASLMGAIAVAMGAWAAHGLEALYGMDAAQRAATGAHYQIVHALAVPISIWLSTFVSSRIPRLLPAVLFTVGNVLFPSALYVLALGGASGFGAVAPIGGVSFILGWLLLALTAATGTNPDRH